MHPPRRTPLASGSSPFLIPTLTAILLLIPGSAPVRANSVTAWQKPLYLRRCSYKRPIQLPTDQSAMSPSMLRVSGDGKTALGIVISRQGHILTSGMVAGAGTVRAELAGGRTIEGRVLRLDLLQDVALVKIPARHLATDACLTLGRNNTPSIGTKLFLLAPGQDDAREVEVKSHQIWNQVAYFRTIEGAKNGMPVVNKNGTVVGLITRNLAGPNLKGKALGVPLSSIRKRLCLAWQGESTPSCEINTAREFEKLTGRQPRKIQEPPASPAEPEPAAQPAPRRPAVATGDGGVIVIASLAWTACSRGQTWQPGGKCRGLSKATNWEKARRYCKNITTGGRGWRLPSREELESLLRESGSGPRIDGVAFPRTAPQPYWTDTNFRDAPGSAWYVNFRNGSSYGESKLKHKHVRCVAR